MTPAPAPAVAVIATGGTITSVGHDALDLVDYDDTGQVLSAQEIVARTPALGSLARLVAIDFDGGFSDASGPDVWLALRRELIEVLGSPDVRGAVVLHGTSTLEETAYFLHLTLDSDKPVALVGAQRPASAISADGPMNIAAAVRVAVSAPPGSGVLVVMQDEIHCAREVTKAHTVSGHAFRSPDFGPLGRVDADGTVRIERASLRRHTTTSDFRTLPERTELPKVAITYSFAGADGTAITAAVDAGAAGIVIAALAPGIAAAGEMAALRDARARGVAVFLSTRARSGPTSVRASDRALGVIAADTLPPQKARILAMLALSRTDDAPELAEIFATH